MKQLTVGRVCVGVLLMHASMVTQALDVTVLAGAKNVEGQTLPLLLRNDQSQCVLVATVTGDKVTASKERCKTKNKGKLTESAVSLSGEVDHSPIKVGEKISLR